MTAKTVGDKLINVLKKDVSARQFGNLGSVQRLLHSVTPENIDEINDSILAAIESMDPTPNKQYTPWLARMYANGGLKMEDMNRSNLIGIYDLAKKRKMIRPEHADINRFKSYKQFEDTMLGAYDIDTIEAGPKKDNKGEAKTVYDDENVRIIVPENEDAACYYGRGTRWCTAATQGLNYFNQYNRQGPMYIMLPKHPEYDGEKYQLHFPSGQFMDEGDDQIDVSELLTKRFPGTIDYFREAIPEIVDMPVFASPEDIKPHLNEFLEDARQVIDEYFNEWQMNDDYYSDWQKEQAREKGYLLMPDGSEFENTPEQNAYLEDNDIDISELDIDRDRMFNDDELNDYFEYNYEAGRANNRANEALDISPEDIIEAFREDGELNEYGLNRATYVAAKQIAYDYLAANVRRDAEGLLNALDDIGIQ